MQELAPQPEAKGPAAAELQGSRQQGSEPDGQAGAEPEGQAGAEAAQGARAFLLKKLIPKPNKNLYQNPTNNNRA